MFVDSVAHDVMMCCIQFFSLRYSSHYLLIQSRLNPISVCLCWHADPLQQLSRSGPRVQLIHARITFITFINYYQSQSNNLVEYKGSLTVFPAGPTLNRYYRSASGASGCLVDTLFGFCSELNWFRILPLLYSFHFTFTLTPLYLLGVCNPHTPALSAHLLWALCCCMFGPASRTRSKSAGDPASLSWSFPATAMSSTSGASQSAATSHIPAAPSLSSSVSASSSTLTSAPAAAHAAPANPAVLSCRTR